MVGRDKSRTYWKVLKIDRTEPAELNIREDPATYTERECSDLLRRIHEGNRVTGGLKFVTSCYGIVGTYKLRVTSLPFIRWAANLACVLVTLFSRIH